MVYGARLESVLGASPREFESRILRFWKPLVRQGLFAAPHMTKASRARGGSVFHCLLASVVQGMLTVP